jgi:hypothetical protein
MASYDDFSRAFDDVRQQNSNLLDVIERLVKLIENIPHIKERGAVLVARTVEEDPKSQPAPPPGKAY